MRIEIAPTTNNGDHVDDKQCINAGVGCFMAFNELIEGRLDPEFLENGRLRFDVSFQAHENGSGVETIVNTTFSNEFGDEECLKTIRFCANSTPARIVSRIMSFGLLQKIKEHNKRDRKKQHGKQNF